MLPHQAALFLGGLLVLLLAGLQPGAAQRDCYGAVVEARVFLATDSSQTLQALFGYPGPFGARLNDSELTLPALAAAEPLNACGGAVAPPPEPGAAALVARGNCSFAAKAQALQQAGFGAMLLFNDEEECVLMSANRSEVAGVTLAVASLTEEAGALLQQLLAEHPGEQLGLALRMPAEGPIDWSSLVLWLIASGTVAAGALWAGQGVLPSGAAGPPGARKPGGAELLPSVTISSHAAVGFVVMASTILVVLFFLLSKWLAYILVGMFALGAWQACGIVLFSALQHTSSAQWRGTYLRLPLAGLVPANGVAATAVAGALCATWAVWHNAVWSWPLQDTMGVCFMLVVLKQFFLPNLKVATILLCLAFVYDVWWVFLQPLVTGGASVMIEVATGGSTHEQLPMVLRIPHHPLGINPAFALLGLGDVVLPGLLAVFCRRFDLTHRLSLARGFFLPCIVGYGTGLLTTYCALWFSWFGDQGQPALLYLVPGTLCTVTLLALSRGQWQGLWSNEFDQLAGSSPRGGGGGEQADRDAERVEAGLERLLPDGQRS